MGEKPPPPSAPSTGICPRCRRRYARPARVCLVDGSPLVDEERLLEQGKTEAEAERVPAKGEAPKPERRSPLPPKPSAAPATSKPPPPPRREPSPASVTPVRSFERLGPYRLLRLLGEGGMARIYLAEHEKISRICAIKRLHADHLEDRITVARFLAEARAVSDISHSNLVAVYDVVEEPNEIYIVMEYLDGVDVAQVLRDEQRLDPRRAARIAAEACDGLQPVHERKIIHRDLKPENIFLAKTPEGSERVKLLDFGVARLTIDRPKELRTRSGLTVGTPTYMSPEQATASEIDPRSDLYAIGVVLYEMISGRPPFVGAGYGDVMLMHVNDPPPRLATCAPHVPPWLEQVVMRCLEKEPEARFQTAAELAEALRAGPGVQAAPPMVRPLLSRRRRLPRGARWIAAGAGALTVGLVASLVALIVHHLGGRVEAQPPPPSHVTPRPPPPMIVPPPPPTELKVEAQPAGAQVRLDGADACAAPCSIRLPPGRPSVQVTVAAAGFVEETRAVDAQAPPGELRFVLKRVRRPRGPIRRDKNSTVDPFQRR